MLKDFAFHVVGTDEEARELDGTRRPGRAVAGPGERQLADDRRPARRAPAAPRRRHRDHRGPRSARPGTRSRRPGAAGQTDHLQVVQNWGAQAGARTNHLCLDLYDLPQIPHRVAEELGGAARFVIREGECPWCRLVRDEPRRPERLVWQDADTVAFAPFASRSPFEVWVVPRRHEADFGRAARRRRRAPPPRPSARCSGALAAGLDGPPYNLVLHTAPLREQVDATYHWHWEIHPRLREIAGLELGTGLPVNPVSPEDAVEELLGRDPAAGPGGDGGDRLMIGAPKVGRRQSRRHTRSRCVVPCPERARAQSAPRSVMLTFTEVPCSAGSTANSALAESSAGRRCREPVVGPGRRRAASSRSCSRSITARSTPTCSACSGTRSSPPT